MSDQRAEIPGSSPNLRETERWSPASDPDQKVSATIVLRRREDSLSASQLEEQLFSGQFGPIANERAAEVIGADPKDLTAVRSFLHQQGLTIETENPEARSLRITGSAKQMAAAFGVQLGSIEDANGHKYLSYQGGLSIPKPLAGVVLAVLGLDERPIAKH